MSRTISLIIREAATPSDLELARRLFEEYSDWIGIDLGFQDFERELTGLPGDYAPPRGALMLAESDGETAGCVALRAIDESLCEMKRLFVRDRFRACGVGRRLAEGVIARGREIGYHAIRLDTLPTMTRAMELYRALGFREIAPYRFNPVEGTRYFELNLQ